MKNGGTEEVRFESTPAGAQVVANGVPHGSTLTTVRLSRCEDYNVAIDKPGYEPASVLLSRTVRGPDAAVGLFDVLLFVPGFVDIWNCSNRSLAPNPVSVQLLPVAANASAPVAAK
jgi:hypothetical protein